MLFAWGAARFTGTGQGRLKQGRRSLHRWLARLRTRRAASAVAVDDGHRRHPCGPAAVVGTAIDSQSAQFV